MPGCCLPHPRATVDGVHPSLSISSTRQPIPFQPTLLMPPASSRAACYPQPHRPSRVALVPDLSYSESSDHRFRRRHHRLYTSTMGVYSRPLRLLYLSAHMLHVFTRVIASNGRWSVSCTRLSRLYLNPAAHTLDLHTSSPSSSPRTCLYTLSSFLFRLLFLASTHTLPMQVDTGQHCYNN